MKERYCPKAECYYHGYEYTCPEHGIKTKQVRKPKDIHLTPNDVKETRGGGVDHSTQKYLLYEGPLTLEDGTIISMGLTTKTSNKLGKVDYIERANKPAKMKQLWREGHDKDDKLGWFNYFNHSEQLGYKCFGHHEGGYYVIDKYYPLRTTTWYSEFERMIRESDKFLYGGFDAHEEGQEDIEEYYG